MGDGVDQVPQFPWKLARRLTGGRYVGRAGRERELMLSSEVVGEDDLNGSKR
jgi:hypothetical protein